MSRANERELGGGSRGTGESSLSRILRDRTAQAHHIAEAALRLDFDRPDASGYVTVLNGLLVFHTAVEECSRETVAKTFGPNTILLSRAHSLRTDIGVMSQRLQVGVDEGCPSRSGTAFANQLRGGCEERIGAAYVAAGSVLGGRVIAANLAASGCREFPRSFFLCEGLDVGRLWHDFKTALDDYGKSGADSGRVVAGALAAYALFHDILSRPDASSGAA